MKEQFLKWATVLLISFIALSNSQAQSPGYLGKKFSIGIGTSFYPAVYGPSKNKKALTDRRLSFNETIVEEGFAMNSTLELSVDYAQWRYGSIGIYGSQLNTGLRVNYTASSTSNIFVNTFHLLKANTIGIRYSRFKASKGALAPIGRYVSYGLEGIFVEGITESAFVNQTSIDPEILDFEQKANFLNLTVKYMMSYPLSERLLIKAGGSIRIPQLSLSTIFRVLDVDDDIRGDKTIFAENFKYLAIRRVALHGIMRLELNFSYLLF